VARGDAFLVGEAGKIPGRLQLLERALIEMKGRNKRTDNWAKRFTKGKRPSSGALDLRDKGRPVTIGLEPAAGVPAKRIEWQEGEESGLSRQQLGTLRSKFPGVDIREMERQFMAWKEAKGVGAGVSAENYSAALSGFIKQKLKRGA